MVQGEGGRDGGEIYCWVRRRGRVVLVRWERWDVDIGRWYLCFGRPGDGMGWDGMGERTFLTKSAFFVIRLDGGLWLVTKAVSWTLDS